MVNLKKLYRYRRLVALGAICITVSSAAYEIATSGNPEPPKAEIVYTVQQGDTLWGITSKFVDGSDNILEVMHGIKKQNDIENGYLVPGQKIKIELKVGSPQ